MNCEEHQRMMSELLDGELTQVDEEGLYRHLGSCKSCREFMRASMRIRVLMLQNSPEAVPSSLDARVESLEMNRAAILGRSRRWILSLLRARISLPAPAIIVSSIAVVISLIWGGSEVMSRRANAEKLEGEQHYMITMPEVEIYEVLPPREGDTH